jgi:xylulokinase
VDRQKVDVSARVAGIVGAQPGYYNYFAEQETAGKCLEWVKDHMALDEINIYLEKKHVTDDIEARYTSLYEYMVSVISEVPAGSGGIIFTPWLHGNRCPFEDPLARGMFFNLSLNSGKAAMIRAVVEGIILHQKWMLESVRRSFPVKGPLRFVGGGALSPVISQIMADIMEMPVQLVAEPQNAGASGAALTAAAGLGLVPGLESASDYIPLLEIYQPSPDNRDIYRKHFRILKGLYKANRRFFSELNSGFLHS